MRELFDHVRVEALYLTPWGDKMYLPSPDYLAHTDPMGGPASA